MRPIRKLAAISIVATVLATYISWSGGSRLLNRQQELEEDSLRKPLSLPIRPRAGSTWQHSASLPQGHDPRFWPASAQAYHERCSRVLQTFFPGEWPGNASSAGKPLNDKQQFLELHGPRFTHALFRASPHIAPGARILTLGGSQTGHVPVLIQKLFKPKFMKATTTQYPANHTYQDEDGKKLQFEIEYHDLESGPLPLPAGSIDHVFLLDTIQSFRGDPAYALLDIHRVLKPEGTLFVSSPHAASFQSLIKMTHGASPYLYSLFISEADGKGRITHPHEYSWQQLQEVLQQTGFSTQLKSYNSYPDELPYWDYKTGFALPEYKPLWETLPAWQQSLDVMGLDLFVVATKSGAPRLRRPGTLYVRAPEHLGVFSEYPSCDVEPLLCERRGAEQFFKEDSPLKYQLAEAARRAAAVIAASRGAGTPKVQVAHAIV